MKRVLRFISTPFGLLFAAVVLAGIHINAAYTGDDGLDSAAIQNAGHTNQYRRLQIVEFCFMQSNPVKCAKFSHFNTMGSLQWERVSAPYTQETNNATPLCANVPGYMCCINHVWERLPSWSWTGEGPMTNFDADYKLGNSSTWNDLATGSGLSQCVPVTPSVLYGMDVRVRTITPAGNSDWCKIPLPGQSCEVNGCP